MTATLKVPTNWNGIGPKGALIPHSQGDPFAGSSRGGGSNNSTVLGSSILPFTRSVILTRRTVLPLKAASIPG